MFPLIHANSSFSTIVDVLMHRAEHQGEVNAFLLLADGGRDDRALSFRELDLQARRIAAHLTTCTQPGDRVLLLFPSGLEFLSAFFGCLYAGVIAIPAHAPHAGKRDRTFPRLQAIAVSARPRVALTTSDLMPTVQDFFSIAPEFNGMELLAADDLAAEPVSCGPLPPVRETDIAFLQYTSGSTGSPKGVMVSHANLLHNEQVIRDAFAHPPLAPVVGWLPFFHDMGLIGNLLHPLCIGVTSVLMPPAAFLQRPLRWLEAISRFRAASSGGPNFAYELCVERIRDEDLDSLDLSCWQLAFNGAEPVRPDTLRRFSEKFARCGFHPAAFYPCYGLAEATLLVTGGNRFTQPRMLHVDAAELGAHHVVPVDPNSGATIGALELVSSGQVWLDQEVAIVDPQTCESLGEDRVGEIWVSGPSVTCGYWERPEESRAQFAAEISQVDSGKFLRTGDLGFLHQGELYVTGRIKDLIIIRGANHYPQDIEQTIEECHATFSVGSVVAFSVERAGEEQLVIVAEPDRALRKASAAELNEIITTVRRAVALQHGLETHAVLLVKFGGIPKTSSGKLQRQQARHLYLEEKFERLASWANVEHLMQVETVSSPVFERKGTPTQREIQHWLQQRLSARLNVPVEQIDINVPFAEYALGSKEAVVISGELEDWLNCRLPATLLYEFTTIVELSAHLATQGESVATTADQISDSSQTGPIAIIGIGCRVPGAQGPQAFWNLLSDGVDAIREVPPERWDVDAFFHSDPQAPGKMNTRWGGFLEDIDQFDPGFFGIAPREAARMDPQQRLLLEVAWEALIDAGLPPESLSGTPTGVFVGISSDDYGRMQIDHPSLSDAYAGTGSALSIAANRISYLLNLRGRSLAVDTACSSSLLAVDLACQSLRTGESDIALAGGVNLILSPQVTVNFSKAGFMSPDGRCQAFDANANGYVRSEGAGIVVLKPLASALADGDPIYAVIRGSAVNQDGRSNGLTAPNPQSQEAVLRSAYRNAGICPADIQYVEAHGTGTFLGDPIEARALGSVLAEGRSADNRCRIGSVKTNIGHLEAAAGVTGLIKVALALRNRWLPASLHFHKPNPHIPFETLPLRVQSIGEAWETPADKTRLAGVSSFGFGGTNVHVVLEEAPSGTIIESTSPLDRPELFTLSAQSPVALQQLAREYTDRLKSAEPDWMLADVVATASLHRSQAAHRFATVTNTLPELQRTLNEWLNDSRSGNVVTGRVQSGDTPRVVFVCGGQGTQRLGMGLELYETESVFRDAFDDCARRIAEYAGWSMIDELRRSAEEDRLERTEIAQPALFSVQVALAALWQSWGVVPDAVVGHSLGEVAAAHFAGVLSLEDAIRLIVDRGRLMQNLAGKGRMLALEMSRPESLELVHRHAAGLVVAAENGKNSTVLSGDASLVVELAQRLERQKVYCRVLRGDVAFHCHHMETVRSELVARFRQLAHQPPSIPLYSTVTGKRFSADDLGAEYWGRNAREPVLFRQSVETLLSDGFNCFIELGPHPTLTTAIVKDAGDQTVTAIPSLRRGQGERAAMLSSLATLWTRGVPSSLSAVTRRTGKVLPLPAFAWQRERFWLEEDEIGQGDRSRGDTLAIGSDEHREPDLNRWFYQLKWEAQPLPSTSGRILPADFLPSPAATGNIVEAEMLPEITALGRFDGLRMLLDQLSVCYAFEAFTQLAGPLSVGTIIHPAGWPVVPQHDRLLARLLAMLVEDGLIQEHADINRRTWRVINLPKVQAATLQAELARDYDDCAHELLLLKGCGSHLADVLAGRIDPVELLFPQGSSALVEHLYQDSPFATVYNQCMRLAVRELVRQHSGDRPLRILELGAGTGGTTAHVLPELPAASEYVFTDISAAFMSAARQKFADKTFLEYRPLDIESDPRSQGFVAHSFDLIIAANVLHATRNLQQTLEHARQLLAPSGQMLLLEITHPDRWLDLVFGLTDGWWRYEDTDVRPAHPLLSRDRWCDACLNAGFADVRPIPDEKQFTTQAVILAQNTADLASSVSQEQPPWWILAAPDCHEADEIAALLTQAGERVFLIQPGEDFAQLNNATFQVCAEHPAHWHQLVERTSGVAGPACRGIITLWGLELPTLDAETIDWQTFIAAGTGRVTKFVQILGDMAWHEKPRLWLVTRGAQGVAGSHATSVEQSPLWGLGRVIGWERPDLWGGLVDLDPATSPEHAAAQLVRDLLSLSAESQFAYRNGNRYVARLDRQQTGKPRPVKLQKDASYLITGGLGDLGLQLARWLTMHGARRIVLLGRTPLPRRREWKDLPQDSRLATQAAAIREIEALGASVMTAAVDVGDQAALQEFLADYEADGWPPIRGVIHAAMVLENRTLANIDQAHLESIMLPKIVGAWTLHRAFAEQPLDFFLLFSSAAALLGSPGQASYCAANAFLDQLAGLHSAQSSPATSIQWGPWAAAGWVARREKVNHLALRGIAGFSTAAGLTAFGHLLRRNLTDVGVLQVDWQEFARFNPLATRLPLFANLHTELLAEVEQIETSNCTREQLLKLPAAERIATLTDQLKRQVARLLGMSADRLESGQPLNTLGFDSLMAVELRNWLERQLSVDVPVVTFLQGASLADVAQTVLWQLAEATIDLSGPALQAAAEIVTEFPLSQNQQALWVLHELLPDETGVNCPAAMRIQGELNIPALRRAFEKLAQRHPALRSTIHATDTGPVQRIHESLGVPFHIVNIAGWSDESLQQRISADADFALDFVQGPLLRVVLYERSPLDHILLMALDHIVVDFWSLTVLFQDLGKLYSAEKRGESVTFPPHEIQYSDYVRWERDLLDSPAGEAHWQYWSKQLAGELPILNLRTDRPRSGLQTFNSGVHRVAFSPELSQRVRDFAEKSGATLYTTLLAAYQLLLCRESGQSEVIVGSVVSGRDRMNLSQVVGYIIKPVALRGDLSANPTFATFLDQMRECVLNGMAHQDYPLVQLARRLKIHRDPSVSPIFQTMFVLQKAQMFGDKGLAAYALGKSGIPVDLGELPAESVTVNRNVGQFDLTLMMAEADDLLHGAWIYNTDLFDPTTIARFAEHFETLVEAFVTAPETTVWELPLVPASTAQQLLIETNQTESPCISAPIHTWFERQVQAAPHSIAVKAEDATALTYAELNEQANRWARLLIERGVQSETRVAICLERSVDLIVAILAVVKSGGCYVPLDPAYPADRLKFMMDDAAAEVLLTSDKLRNELPDLAPHALCLDADEHFALAMSAENIARNVLPEQLAYVIYTSGSTGTPKGVAVPHRGLCHLVQWHLDTYGVNRTDRMTHLAGLAFDASVWELWPVLCGGATLCLVPQEIILAPGRLLQWMADEAITISFLPTPLAEQVLGESPPAELTMRRILTGGDALRQRPSESLPYQLINHYGPTENTVVATCGPVSPLTAELASPPHIGRPIANTTVYVLDRFLNPVPVGVPGELFISGDSLARGYLERTELTAATFLPNPFSGVPGARMYRTGDAVRWLPDGNLEFLERLDQQVKIRGFRIELGEIETVLGQHPAVRNVIVLPWSGANQVRRLVAYVVPSDAVSPDIAELRTFLKASLPEYMVPSAFMLVNSIPLTPNGKVDRKALPAPEGDISGRPEYVSPVTADELKLAAIWGDVLGMQQIGVNDNFFDLGGDSILATQVVSRLRSAFEVDLPLRRMFEDPTVAGIAAALDTARKSSTGQGGPIVPIARDGELPLSSAQQRLWFLDQLLPGSSLYNVPMAARLRGTLDVAALTRSLNEIVQRHEVLRTTFLERDGRGLPQALPQLELPCPLVDLSPLTAEEQTAELHRLAGEEARKPFFLNTPPLLRVKLVKLSDAEHVLLLTMHHIVSDGWSMGVLLAEIGSLYEAFRLEESSPLPPLPIQYVDFAAWQQEWLQSSEVAAQQTYWHEQLAGLVPLDLPIDHSRPQTQSFRGGHVNWDLRSDFAEKLRELSSQQGTTLYMTLLAAFEVWLHRVTGQTDIAIGSPIAGRNRSEVEGLIGFFVNSLVLREDLSGNPRFTELLTKVRETSLAAYAHQDVPFEKLVEDLQPERDLGRSPLFQVMFALQNTPIPRFQLTDLVLQPEDFGWATSKYDLSLFLWETEGRLHGAFEYNSDLFEEATITRFVSQFETLIAGILHNPRGRIAEIPLVPSAEKQLLLHEWNATQRTFSEHKLLHTFFEQQVQIVPNKTAIIFGNERQTYAELNAQAERVARQLRLSGVGPDVPVAVCEERSLGMVAGILGVLKAGGYFVPLDPAYPANRLAFMLDDSQAKVILSQRKLESLVAELSPSAAGRQIIWLDELERHDSHEIITDTVEPVVMSSQNLAYVIYTSGSTGLPKGAMIPHASAANFLDWSQCAFPLSPHDKVLQKTPISFDASIWELFAPLTTGATLVVADPGRQADPQHLAELIEAEQVTHLKLVPSLLRMLLESGVLDRLTSLREIFCGGEALPGKLLQQAQARTSARIRNLYGPTETTVDVTGNRCEDDFKAELPASGDAFPELIPIGKPISNVTAYVLGPGLEPVPIGVAGELVVGGAGLGRGYLKHPELTAEKFVPNPFSNLPGERLYRTGDRVRWNRHGNLEFLGRIDHQIKLRGFRIELGEIENALRAHPDINDALVILDQSGTVGPRLVAYVVGTSVEQGELRTFLKQRIPEYMIPSACVTLESWPLLPNGKLDRKSLPATTLTDVTSTEFVAPRDDIESAMADIWSDILGLEKIGVLENFFEIGGHSLLATQVMSRIRSRLNRHIPLRVLFENPTIASLAQAIQTSGVMVGDTAPLLEAQPRGGHFPLSFSQQRLWFLDQLMPGSTFYNIPAVVRIHGPLDTDALDQSLQHVVERHELLRTTFVMVDGQPVQLIHDDSAVRLSVIDFTMLSAEDAECDAQRVTRKEADRAFDLVHGPLLRVTLVKITPTEQLLLLMMHHIISDAWSMGLLVRELATAYEAFRHHQPPHLPALRIQYADFAAWQRNWLKDTALEQEIDYWRKTLDGAPGSIDLPTDFPRPRGQSFKGARHSLTLSPELTSALKDLGNQERVTLFMTLLATFQMLLSRYSGQTDISVGGAVAGRNRPELESLMGFLVNTLVFRTDLSGQPTFRELLRRVRDVSLGAFAHQDVAFDLLVEHLHPERELGRNPFFQVMLVLQNTPIPAMNLPDLSLEPVEVELDIVKFDLVLNAMETDAGLQLTLAYSTDLFRSETIQRMLSQLQMLLETLSTNLDLPLHSVPLLLEQERIRTLRSWNATHRPFFDDQTIHAQFESQVRRTPAAPALRAGEATLTYAELNERANQLAHYLKAQGVGTETLVGICLARSAEMIVAVLAVLKAGGAYVPLDPTYPATRLTSMLDDAQVSVLVTQEGSRPLFAGRDITLVCCDQDAAAIAAFSRDNPVSPTTAANLAYVIYTSGSTGLPKGVLLQHRGLSNLVAAQIRAFGITTASRVLQFASFSFDASVSEIFTALIAGATLCLTRPESLLPGPGTIAQLAEEKITTVTFPPSFLQVLPFVELPALETLVVAGESCPPDVVERWSAGRRFLNGYGPTEATVCGTIYDGPVQPGNRLPIGPPIQNVHAYVLDSIGQPQPIGIPGELYLGGVGLARGYLGQPELTATRFVPDPFSDEPGARLYRTGDLVRWLEQGQLEFLGRIDEQVKIRGFRIEPGEIAAVLETHPEVQQACVMARDDRGQGTSQLVAYFVTNSAIESLTTAEVRRFLAARLPDHLIPSAFVQLDMLPLSPNGKIDRKALPVPEGIRPDLTHEFVPPQNALEARLAALWQDVLGLERIGIHDNFFELGGNSIQGAILINRLQEALAESVYVVALFDAPTVANLASYLAEHYPEAVEKLWGIDVRELGFAVPEAAHQPASESEFVEFRSLLHRLPARPVGEPASRNPSAVFVLSPPRSGSTLFRVILGGNPGLFAPPELELLGFNTLADRKSAFTGKFAFWLEGTVRTLMESEHCDAETAQRLMASFEDQGLTVQQFYRRLQEAVQPRLLVDKTPSYALDLETLRRAEADFENARFIHLVRHPAGMMRSFLDARTDQVFFRETHSFTTPKLAEMIWRVSQENILEFLGEIPTERKCQVRFEDLLRDPRTQIESLCQFLNVPFAPQMLEPYEETQNRMTDGIHPLSKMLGDVKFHQHSGISARSADRWRDQEVFPISEATWQLSELLGYQREGDSVAVPEPRELAPIQRVTRVEDVESLLHNMDQLSDEEVAALLRDLDQDGDI